MRVHCGQTAGRIEMPLGTNVGTDKCHIVLDGVRIPPREGGVLLGVVLLLLLLFFNVYGGLSWLCLAFESTLI